MTGGELAGIAGSETVAVRDRPAQVPPTERTCQAPYRSPDGKNVPGTVRVIALAGMLAACGGPGWSPERAELLFMSNRDGNAEVYLSSGVGAEWTNLTNHPGTDNWPEWSPDGTRIAFQSDRAGNLDIWLMDPDGADLVRLTDDEAHDYLPAWSPDGTEITFASRRVEPGDEEPAVHVYVMNADGSEQRRLFPESPGTSAGAPWAPDGSGWLLTRRTGEASYEIFFAAAPPGSRTRQLTALGASSGAPAFSPDGTRIACYASRGQTSQIVVMDRDGQGSRVLVAAGESWYPRWSPDGRWLTYTAAVPGGRAGDLDILAIPVDGGTPITLVSGPGREAEGRWRPVPPADPR